jgi:hypothetical protein
LHRQTTRPISWLKAARREFEVFPEQAQLTMLRALAIAAEGGKSDIAKPFKGIDSGIFEIALKYIGATLIASSMQFGSVTMCGWSMRFRRNPRLASKHRRSMWTASRSGSNG